jgi:hypothetical protein
VPYVGHALLHPWAISLTGKATLTGYWQGEVVFAPGDRRELLDRTLIWNQHRL